MLTTIRTKTKSFLVKVLAGLLMLSFGAWGIGDMVGLVGAPSTILFEVGDEKVEMAEVEDEVRREIRRLQPLFGNQFGIEQAKALGIVDTIIQRRINDASLHLAAMKLGVAVSDDLVRNTIRNNANFQGLGGFDRNRFQQLLNENLLTESGYIAQLRQQMGRYQLIDSFSTKAAPKSMVASMYRLQQEKRIAETIEIKDSAQKNIPDPDAATLAAFHKKNATRFTAPEYRALTVLRLAAKDLAAEITLSDEDVKKAYEARIDEFSVKETRQIQQIVVDDENVARQAKKAIDDGGKFVTVAKEVAKLDEATIDLGQLNRLGLPFPELVEAAFNLKEGEVSQPVKSPLGWHLFRASGIVKGGIKTLDEVKGTLSKTVAHEKAVDSLFNLANKLEDALGGGATLEEAATRLNVKVEKISALDSSGKDKSGKALESLPGGDFLKLAFSTNEGGDSPLTESGEDGYFVLRIDGVTAPALKPLGTINDEVVAAWKADERAEKSKEVATSVVGRVNGGAGFDVISEDMRISFKTSPAFTRQPQKNDTGLPQALITKVFVSKLGQAVMARIDGGYVVARLKKIVAADPAKDAQGVKSLSGQIGTAIELDILGQLAGAYRERFGVTLNRKSVESLFIGSGRSSRRAPGR